MRRIFRTDSEKKSKKEPRQETAIKQRRKGELSTAARDISSHDSDSASNESLRTTLGGNANANESVISFFTALASIDVPPTEASLTEASPTEASFELESDTDSVFSLHEATPVIVCSSPNWMTEHIDMLENFGDGPQQVSLSKRDAMYASGYDRPNIVLFTSHDSASPLLHRQDGHHMSLEPCHLVQTFTEGSFISRSTQVTTTVRTPSDGDPSLRSEVTITGGRADSPSPIRPGSAGTQSQSSLRALMGRSKKTAALPNTPKRAPSPSVSSRGAMTDGWTPPTTWDCTLSTKGSLSEIAVVTEEATMLDEDLLTNLPAAQQDVNRIVTKSSSISLFRLKKSRSNLKGPSSCKETEETGEMHVTTWTTNPLDYES
ncbi:hypothetical protein B0J13DRAFT_638500 [Dactylonectria estremocensis]|uniref:Uncharacterized protein n=1 Tax=Dactylonectria estremocensis TaxID=1079267 RepID=A0A9P9ELF4_9HYPO|nr:hypothetical protein B0J13DRAFT_638500 [Dactylonectria estremocensis]